MNNKLSSVANPLRGIYMTLLRRFKPLKPKPNALNVNFVEWEDKAIGSSFTVGYCSADNAIIMSQRESGDKDYKVMWCLPLTEETTEKLIGLLLEYKKQMKLLRDEYERSKAPKGM